MRQFVKFSKRTVFGVGLALSLMMSGCAETKSEEQEPVKNNAETEQTGETAELWVPTEDVTIICGYSAGGSTDLFARLTAQYLSEHWGVNVIVDNVTGGSGAVGMSQCLKANADGHTVTISNGASLTLSASGNVDWMYSDFTNLGKVIDEDELLCVKSDSKFTSLDELIDYSKDHPGEVSIGFAGVGGFTYLAAQRFINEMGLQVKTVAYDSGSEAVTAVMGGFVDFCMQQPAEVASGLESGALKCLAIMSEERHPSELLKDVSTAQEQGYDFVTTQWRGISGPKDMPEEIENGWISALETVTADENYQKEAENALLARINPVFGNEMDVFMDEEYEWIDPMMQKLNLSSKTQ